MLDDLQREEISELISAHESSRRLSSGQKWDAAVLMASFLGGAIAVLGVAGYFVVENAAKVRAGQVAAADVATQLLTGEELVTRIRDTTVGVPNGAVVAFDVAAGCPAGWIEFASARGRTIIGVRESVDTPDGLLSRPFQEQGGAETHTLSIAEMPEHRHQAGRFTLLVPATADPQLDIPNAQQTGGAGWYGVQSGTMETTSTGGGEPHNNMPPYIALYFCKKEKKPE